MFQQFSIPMEAGSLVCKFVEKTGRSHDAVGEDLAAAIAAKINKAYYRGKFERGEALALAENIIRVFRRLEDGEINVKDAEFFALLYAREAEAFDAGRKERMGAETASHSTARPPPLAHIWRTR